MVTIYSCVDMQPLARQDDDLLEDNLPRLPKYRPCATRTDSFVCGNEQTFSNVSVSLPSLMPRSGSTALRST
jgi:hypothetical protein